MKTISKRICVSCLLVVGLSLSAVAEKSGKDYYNPITTGVPSLSIAPDARGGSMGDVGVATTPDINSQYWNPAKYANINSVAGVSLSYTPWLRKIVKDIDLAYLAGYYKIGDLQAVSMSLRYFSLGSIQLTDNEGNSMGTGKPNEFSLDVAYSRQLSKYFSMAVALRYIYSGLGVKDEDYKPGHAFGADIAMYSNIPLPIPTGTSNLSFGLNISNLSTKISYDNNTKIYLPANMRLGVTYDIPFDAYNRLNLNFDIDRTMVPAYPQASNYEGGTTNEDYKAAKQKYETMSSIAALFYSFADSYHNPSLTKKQAFVDELREVNWAAGVEYSYNNQFFGRLGYHNESKWKGNRKYFTLGAGFKLTAFSLDVGYVVGIAQTTPLDQTLRFTLGFDIDGLKELTDWAERRKNK